MGGKFWSYIYWMKEVNLGSILGYYAELVLF